jgi:hypothetical protein
MNFDPHSPRFNPRWLLPANETDVPDADESDNATPVCADEDSSEIRAWLDFDEALDQIASDGHRVCPLCGAVVASDGSIVSPEPPGQTEREPFRDTTRRPI